MGCSSLRLLQITDFLYCGRQTRPRWSRLDNTIIIWAVSISTFYRLIAGEKGGFKEDPSLLRQSNFGDLDEEAAIGDNGEPVRADNYLQW